MSIAPARMLQAIGALEVMEARLMAQWGQARSVVLYLVDADVGGVKLPGVQVAGDEGTDEIVLGRNILNKLTLLLDGPEQHVAILDAATVERLRSRSTADSS